MGEEEDEGKAACRSSLWPCESGVPRTFRLGYLRPRAGTADRQMET